MKNSKGFTLVEVIVAVALMAIVIAPIGFMIISQSRSAKDNQDKVLVQQNTQIVMSAFRTYCIPASAVTEIRNSGGISEMSNSVSDLDFSVLKVKNNYTGEVTTYQYDSSTGTFSVKAPSGSESSVSNVKLLISPLPDTADYATCKGLKISVSSEITNAGTGKTNNSALENQFYFRNTTS